jgi:hypothetical protein
MFDATNQYELSLLINGNRVSEYYHNGNMFVEGRANSTYELQVRNNSPERIMAILSVDGLGVIDGQAAGADSPGYVIEPYQTLTVPGWKVDGDTAAKFQFGSSSGSYSNRTGRGKKNVGVVGLMVFRPQPTYNNAYFPSTSFTFTDYSMSNGWPQNSSASSVNNVLMGTSTCIGSGLDADSVRSMTSHPGVAASLNSTVTSTPSAVSKSVTQSLGTEYGDATKFETKSVTFTKRDPNYPDALIAIYYDDAQGLEARGIILPYRNTGPQAFPTYTASNSTTYASPPPGWQKR